MKIRSALTIILLIACGLLADGASAQASDSPPSVTLPPALDRVLRDYEKAWSSRSAAGLAELFAEDGFVLQPGRPPARGRKNIQERYEGRGGPLSLRALEYAASDSIGYIIGAYSIARDERDIGKFILLVKRVPPGPWYIAADMDNGNN